MGKPSVVIVAGARYGRLIAIQPCGRISAEQRVAWLFRCDCGNEIQIIARTVSRKRAQSCGCLKVDKTRERMTTHGRGSARTPDRVYQTWARMISRCSATEGKDWNDYAGRGIRVCEEWRHDFPAFAAYIGPRPSPIHSIDRIDVNGNYEPGNVRWATPKEQARNRRSNRLVTINGVTRCMAEWLELNAIDPRMAEARVSRWGWSYERAVTEPASYRKPRVKECAK